MKTRDRTFEKYQKEFDKAKTQAEKILICQKASKDPKFTPCLPSSMDYDAASHQNDGRGCVLFDIDDTLIAGTDRIVIDDALVDASKRHGITEAYAFSSMEVKGDNRLAVIAYLALSGIQVKGMIAQAEAAPDVKPGLLFELYHEYHTSKKLSPQRKAEIERIIKQNHGASEVAKSQYFESDAQRYRGQARDKEVMYGAKTRMMADFLDKNPGVKNAIAFDDAGANLLGMIKILLDRQAMGMNTGTTLKACLVHPSVEKHEEHNEYRWDDDFDKFFSNLNSYDQSRFILSCMNDPLSKMMKDGKISKGIQSSDEFKTLQAYVNQAVSQSDTAIDMGQLRKHIEALAQYAIDEPSKTDASKKIAFDANFPHIEMICEVYNTLTQAKNNDYPKIDILSFVIEKKPDFADSVMDARAANFDKVKSERHLALSNQVSEPHLSQESTSGIVDRLRSFKQQFGSRKKLKQAEEVAKTEAPKEASSSQSSRLSSSNSGLSSSASSESPSLPPDPNPSPRIKH